MNFIIAYCTENQNIAHEISLRLKLVDIPVKLIAGDQIKNDKGLQAQLMNPNAPALLLISDNFLKSTECMYMALFLLQANNKTQHIQPIIIDGRYPQPDGNIKLVPTTFERVSNVIQYMNYWQEHYLALRKERKEISESEQAAFDANLKIIRSISSEVGEFLRLLRGVDYWTYDQLVYDDYQIFFETLGRSDLHETFKTKLANTNFTIPTDPKIDAFIEPEPIIEPEPELEPEFQTEEIIVAPPEAMAQVDEVDQQMAPPAQIIQEPPAAPQELESSTEVPAVSNGTPRLNNQQELENNPLLDRLLEYQKDRLEGKDMGDLSDDHYNPDLDQVVLEVVNEENNNDLEANISRSKNEDGYDIIESIFSDEDEEDEDEQEAIIEPASIALKPNTTPLIQFEDLNTRESIENARKLIQTGEITASLELLRNALNREPENTKLRFLYANCLIEATHEYETASKELKKIIDIDPVNVEAYLTLANLAKKRHDFLQAKNYYEKVISLDPNQPGVYFELGMIINNYYDGEEIVAAKYLKKAVKDDPTNVDAHYHYALLLYDHIGDFKKSIKHLKATLSLQENHSFANYDLALIYHRMNKRKKALKYYRKACEINPELKTKANNKAFRINKIKLNQKKVEQIGNSISNASTEDYLGFTGDEIVEELAPLDFLEKMGLENEPVGFSAKASLSNTPKPEASKTVLITGATSGIGRATAELFASKGYRLILTGRRSNRLEIMQKSFLGKHQIEVKTLSFDVRDSETVKAAIEHLPEDWRKVDILINNAGLARGFAPIHEGDLNHWETMIDTNVKGLLYLTRAIAPYMVKRKSGHIVNLSSSAGKEVYPNGNVYCATKHAVEALTKAMRIELHKYNIRVSQVSPGHVEETEFAYVRFEDAEKAKIYEDFQPLKASDVAEAIYFMVSRPAHVNIQDIVLFGTQQASNIFIDRSGRSDEE